MYIVGALATYLNFSLKFTNATFVMLGVFTVVPVLSYIVPSLIAVPVLVEEPILGTVTLLQVCWNRDMLKIQLASYSNTIN